MVFCNCPHIYHFSVLSVRILSRCYLFYSTWRTSYDLFIVLVCWWWFFHLLSVRSWFCLNFWYCSWVKNSGLYPCSSNLQMSLLSSGLCNSENSVNILLFVLLYVFSVGLLGIYPGFQQFNSDVSWHSFLQVYSVLGSLHFLDLWVYGLHQIW